MSSFVSNWSTCSGLFFTQRSTAEGPVLVLLFTVLISVLILTIPITKGMRLLNMLYMERNTCAGCCRQSWWGFGVVESWCGEGISEDGWVGNWTNMWWITKCLRTGKLIKQQGVLTKGSRKGDVIETAADVNEGKYYVCSKKQKKGRERCRTCSP